MIIRAQNIGTLCLTSISWFMQTVNGSSLFPGREAMCAVSREAGDEILVIFPELAGKTILTKQCLLVSGPKGRAGRAIAARHVKNIKPLFAN